MTSPTVTVHPTYSEAYLFAPVAVDEAHIKRDLSHVKRDLSHVKIDLSHGSG